MKHRPVAYNVLRPGLLTSVTRLEQGQSQKQDTFAYDLMGALKTAQYDIPSGGSALRTCGYVWDRAGNRSSMSDSAGPSCSYQTTCLNQYSLVGGEVVFPGNWHELGNYQNIFYTYVNDTRLASVSGNGYNYTVFYDALGRCVVRTMNGSTSCYVYDGEKPIVEYGATFAKTATNIYGHDIDEILQRTDFTYLPNRLLYYQDDHEGNVTHLMMQINNTPTVVESYRYDAFGKPTITNTSGIVTNNRFMFTGREYLSQFGIYEYRNRAYHPALGRFMSEDPKLFVRRAGLGKASDDWSFLQHPDEAEYNLFRYCSNDPVDYTDPLGLFSPEGHDALFDQGFADLLSKKDIAVMKRESRRFDKQAFTRPSKSPTFAHAMRDPGQSANSAIKHANKFIDKQLQAARDALASGDRKKALQELAKAAHTVQDALSPAHVTRDGQPKVWDPFNFTQAGIARTLEHSPSDARGIERTQDITPEIFQENVDAMKKMYEEVFKKPK